MSLKTKAILKRFLKAFISGAIASIVITTYSVPTSWDTMLTTLHTLALVALTGGLSGLLLALQKWASWDSDVI